jgi:hypothetical protein
MKRRAIRIVFVSTLAVSFCMQAAAAGGMINKKGSSAPACSTKSAAAAVQPAAQQNCALKTAAVRTNAAKVTTDDPKVLCIDSLKIIPPQAGSVMLQWKCQLRDTSPVPFEAGGVSIGGYQKTSEGQWSSVGADSAVGRVGPSAMREYAQLFSIYGNSTRFKVMIKRAAAVIKESAEIDMPALLMPDVKITSAPRAGDGWDVTIKNNLSGYSPTGMVLQVMAAKAGTPAAWKGAGSQPMPCLAAQATFTQHFAKYLDATYTVYKVKLYVGSNALDEKGLAP